MPLDKQIRLRASDEEKGHLETAAKDGGYGNLSDYLRPVLLDRHVIIVKPGGEFIVIPAFTADEDARDAAVRTVEGLVALAQSLGEEEASPETQAAAADLLPEAPIAAAVTEEGKDAHPGEPAAPQLPLAGDPPPAPPVAAVPDPPVPAPAAAILGPDPLPEENFDAFVARRTGELQLEGRTSLVASYEAEGEWRAATGTAQAAPEQTAPAPEAAAPANPAFCPHCGTPNGGTAFCAGCGARLA